MTKSPYATDCTTALSRCVWPGTLFAAASPYRLSKAANDKSLLGENPRVDRSSPHVGFRARNLLDPATGGSPRLFVELPFDFAMGTVVASEAPPFATC
ncbi:uncharacterized protein N7518_004549 [Penicillium psychrosexuale]|uniref:uncharacterized protein n=1 Tax=Penicillium psychrosexuale TaxID=1002107 RepID=UPI002544F5CB|nr:uncharacterized protein N7518_004549 [Penicillium psychrosexuale]KAJ5796009.1 hypothetical protein N7518_004549 [Penicillium psychrosexuale]